MRRLRPTAPSPRRLAGAVAAATVLVLCACSSPAPEPPQPTSPTPTAPVLQALTMGSREGQNGALKPWWTGTQVQAEIPVGVAPHDKYRSELFWDRPGAQELRVGEGERLRCRYVLTPHLSGTGADRGVWQVTWQLHGPLKNGDWPQPPLNLHVRGGSWRLGGGAGRPGGHAEYHKPFPAFVDDKQARWDLDVLVSSDPAKARVDAWLDGAHVVADWHPPSGTRYPDHAYLSVKSGLYTGTDDGSDPPAVRRYVSFEPLACSVTPAGTASDAATPPTGPPS